MGYEMIVPPIVQEELNANYQEDEPIQIWVSTQSGRDQPWPILFGFLTPRQKAFVARFEPAVEKALGEKRPAVHWDIVTYDAVMLIADAVRRGGDGTTGLLTALAATKYEGVLGTYEFDQDRSVASEHWANAFAF